MTDIKTRMTEDMKLKGYMPRTQEAYLLAARQFMDHFNRPPEKITEQDIRDYFLYLREEKKAAPGTIRIAIYGIRFLFINTLGLEWDIFGLLGSRQPKKLPVVLSINEVHNLLQAVRNPTHRVALSTIYTLGLRLGECLSLQTDQIDSARLTVWIREGKGCKDRGVPLPISALNRLRHYWKHHRPASDSPYLFLKRDLTGPMNPTTLQKTIRTALKSAGINKQASIHSLRHSYATHLLEAGISLRTVQSLLGHRTMRTTERYLHVTRPMTESLHPTLDQLMSDL